MIGAPSTAPIMRSGGSTAGRGAGVVRGLEHVRRGLWDLVDPVPFARFGVDVEAVRHHVLSAPACYVVK